MRSAQQPAPRPRQDTPLAVLTIRDAGAMTSRQRLALASWLASQAEALVVEGRDYAPRFRARYHAPR